MFHMDALISGIYAISLRTPATSILKAQALELKSKDPKYSSKNFA